jgi:hypothetical protein
MGSYLAFCAKACAGGALALCIALTPMTGQAPAPRVVPAHVSALPGLSLYSSARVASLTTTARTLETYLVRNPNGTLSLNAPASVINGLPAMDVQALGTGLNALNLKISTGQLLTSSAGAVFNPKTAGFAFQGGWTGYGQNWWEAYLCLSHYDIQRMTNFGWWAMTGAGIAAISAFSSVIGAAIGIVVGLYAGWMYLADNGNGSCLNFGHWPPPNIWVSSQ